MALTSEQNIPAKPKPPEEPWSFRKLFPLKATVSSLTKSFTTPFDILLVFQVVIIGISELIGRPVSLGMYFLTGLVLMADIVQRREERQTLLGKKRKEK